MKYQEVQLFTDGGSRNNPGEAAIGFVIFKLDQSNKLVKLDQLGKRLGIATNNVAEYKALIEGLKACQKLGAEKVKCFLDSNLVVNQLNGRYRIKEPGLIPLAQEAKMLEKNFVSVSYTHIPREQNKLADKLVNEAIDLSL